MKYYCKFCKEPFDQLDVVCYGVGWDETGFYSDNEEVSPCCHEDYWIDVDDEFLIDKDGNEIKREDL